MKLEKNIAVHTQNRIHEPLSRTVTKKALA